MSNSPGDTSSLIDDLGRGWNRFWFTPSDPSLVSLLRIGIGLIAFLHLWSFNYDLVRWFGEHGLLPMETVRGLLGDSRSFRLTYFANANTPTLLWTVHVVGLTASAALALGLFARVANILTAIAVLALVHRAPLVSGPVEPVLSFLLIYLCFAPAGAKYSIDQWLMPLLVGRGTKPAFSVEPSILATISLRLMQVHLAAFYLMMGVTKLYGDAWWDGDAIWHLLAQTHSRPLDLTGIRDREYLLNGWTHFVVFTQLAFGVLVWNRFTRPLMLVAATLLWLSLLPVTGLTTFCLLMAWSSLCFLPSGLLSEPRP